MYKKFEILLDEKKVTPYKVSKATGISTATLSDWKSGRSKPKFDKLLTIARFFNVPVEYFADENDDQKGDNTDGRTI